MDHKKIIIVGLTGNSGSGKGEVSRILEGRGGAVLNADCMAREVMLPGGLAFDEVVSVFGQDIVNAGGFIDRQKLGETVFRDAQKKAVLERIVHKYVIEMTERQTEELGKRQPPPRFIVWDAPLLIEAGMHEKCDAVWVVTAPYEVRLARVMARDGLDERRARLRLDSQTPEKELVSCANEVIVNDGDLRGLEARMDALILEINFPSI
ncbi:MAG: dephospho-CoA kinase [Defluviitaleaceae bacterium]|nr:dephospho-CoA kinase [Defluviitaleaceae bacterium]